MSFQRKVYQDHIQILDKDFNLDFYEKFEDPDKYLDLYFLGNNITKLSKHKRIAIVFGNKDVEYVTNYRDKIISRKTIDWDNYPILQEIRDKISKITETSYTVCIFQWYPNGKIGIAPHRDKEMKEGTKIGGVSFGSKRCLQFVRKDVGSIKCDLPSGSLYVMNPPTNQQWAHSILASDTEDGRISLTFRDY